MIDFNPPQYVADILGKLSKKGHAAYLVGGCIRDAIMGRDVQDWDVATSAAPVDVAVIFPETVMTGEKFGTVTVLTDVCTVEVTTFRVEGDYRDNRRPESVEFVSNLSEDLSRRDFTMNAMAISIARNIIDPYEGIKDIEDRIVRCVGDPDKRFSEDALRMFRAFRFRAQLGFRIEEETLAAIYANADRAKLISAERVRVELEKTLMSQRPEIAGEMIKAGILKRYITRSGEIPEGLEKISELPIEPTMRWCAFCAILLKEDFIKATQDETVPDKTAPGEAVPDKAASYEAAPNKAAPYKAAPNKAAPYEAAPDKTAPEFLQKMHLSGKTIKICSRALSISEFPEDRADIKRLLISCGVDATLCAASIHDLLTIRQRESSGDLSKQKSLQFQYLEKVTEIISGNECFTLQKLAVTGRDLIVLGYSQGHELGETLNMLLNHVLEHPEDNKRETLLKIVME